jgi:hypothetical protein
MNATRHFMFVIFVNLMVFMANLAMQDINSTSYGNEILTGYQNSDALNNYADLLESDTGGVNPVTGVFFNDPISWFLRSLRNLGTLLASFVFPFNTLLQNTTLPIVLIYGINTAWALYSIISLYSFVSNK